MQLIKSDIMQPIESVLKSVDTEELISVLRVVVTLAFASDSVAQKMLTRDVLKSLKALCAHRNTEVKTIRCNCSLSIPLLCHFAIMNLYACNCVSLIRCNDYPYMLLVI